MVFSTNQVRQLYVVNKYSTPKDFKTATQNGTIEAGQTTLKIFDDWGQHQDPKTFELLYGNALKELGHSDIIHRENIRKVTYTPASKLRTLPQAYVVSFSEMGGKVAKMMGAPLYMNFTFPGFLNASDEEEMTKTVAVTMPMYVPGMQQEAPNFVKLMVDAINLAFKSKNNIDNTLVKAVEIPNNNSAFVVYAPESGPWYRGVADNKPTKMVIDNLTFQIDPTLLTTAASSSNSSDSFADIIDIITSGINLITGVGKWGTCTDLQTWFDSQEEPSGTFDELLESLGISYINNGKLTADLEYFCMGERGDQYRNMGWPNVIHTKYMVDPDKQYDYVDVHYYFQGEGVRSDKSEKQLTLIADTSNANAIQGLQTIYQQLCDPTAMIDVEKEPTIPTGDPAEEGSGEIQNPVTVTVTTADATKGTVTVTPHGGKSITEHQVTNPDTNTLTVESGTQVILTATPNDGYEFDGWSSNDLILADTTSNPLTITPTDNCTIIAAFNTVVHTDN